MSTIHCPLCGQPHPEGARYCPNTGQLIPEPPTLCPQCGQNLRPDWTACPNCGFHIQGPIIQTRPVRVKPPPKRRQRTGCWVALGAFLALLVIVFTSLFLLLGLHRRNLIAQVLPIDTGMVLSFNPNPAQIVQLYQRREQVMDAFSIFAAIPVLLEANQALVDGGSFPDLNIDIQKEILIWVGPEISLAVLDEERYTSIQVGDGISGGRLAKPAIAPQLQVPMMVTVATRNQRASDAFLMHMQNQLEREGFEFETWSYQDILITEMVSPTQVRLAYATFHHLVVLATHPEVLTDCIDTAQGRSRHALAGQRNYQETLGQLANNRLGYLYFDVPAITGDTSQFFPSLSAIDHVGVAFTLEEEGLRFDYAAQYDLDELTPTQIQAYRQPYDPDQLRQMVPADSLIYYHGNDIHQNWQDFQGNELFHTLQAVQQQLLWELGMPLNQSEIDLEEAMEQLTGVHFTRDLLEKMQGEFALVLMPEPAGLWGDEELPFSLLFYTQVAGVKTFQQDLSKLLAALSLGVGFSLQEHTFGSVPVWLVGEPNQEMTIGFGFIQDVLFIGTSSQALQWAAQGPQEPLADDPLFKAAVVHLPESRGLSYINVADLVGLFYNLLNESEQQDFNETIQPRIDSIQSIAITSGELNDDDWMLGTLFMNLEGSKR